MRGLLMAGIAAVGLAVAAPAAGQGLLFSISGDGAGHFDWVAIRACAATKYSAPSGAATTDMSSPEYRALEFAFHRIQSCRTMMIARHEGWKAGVGQPADAVDPYPPEPMMRPEDMR